jgi:hypothetical protein
MPNFDAGSYFLTTLAPIREGAPEVGAASFRQRLHAVLAALPTALQSPATERIGVQSPFARSLRTHLCRFVIIDDVVYNGRQSPDPIVGRLTGEDPVFAETPDRLNRAYLMFAAEIDAVTEDGAPLPAELPPPREAAVRDGYARSLWTLMETELRAIYANCEGFDGVEDADGFARYLRRCQVETTMPFHDYYTTPPAIPQLPGAALIGAVALPAALAALGLIGWLARMETVPLIGFLTGWTPGPTLVAGAILTAVAAFVAYRVASAWGEKPFPPPQGANLPGVLKALYLQQRFGAFAAAQQGATPAALHKAFGAFLADHRPDEDAGPTQAPGVIRTPAPRAPTRRRKS